MDKMRVLEIMLATCISCSGSATDSPEVEPLGDATVEIYKYATAVKPSLYYEVEVLAEDGGYVMVLPVSPSGQDGSSSPEHNVCVFGSDGPVRVKITSPQENISTATVRPVSKNYDYNVSDGAVFLTLSPYDKAVVELNGSEDNALFIFVNPLETDRPDKEDPNVVYFEAGTETDVNSLVLRSNQTVYLEGGAIIKGNIAANNAKNIALKGCGIVDSRGNGAKAILFNNLDNLEISDIVLLNDINWSTLVAQSDVIKIDNYKVVAVENPENSTGCENDALDILGCKNVNVSRCFGYAHDDVFCIKTHKWDYKGEAKDVVFDGCVAWNYLSGNSFVVGAETAENVSGVTYKNSISIHSAGRPTTFIRGALSIHHCAGGVVSDVLFENMFLEDCKEFGIYLDVRKTSYNIGNGVEYSPGVMRDVTLRNVTILGDAVQGSVLSGYDNGEHRLQNIQFDNVVVDGKKINMMNIAKYFAITNAEYVVK